MTEKDAKAAKLFSFLTRKPMFSELIGEEDLAAISGLNELRNTLVQKGCRSFLITFLDRDDNPGFIWRNASSSKRQRLTEALVEFLVEWDPATKEELRMWEEAAALNCNCSECCEPVPSVEELLMAERDLDNAIYGGNNLARL